MRRRRRARARPLETSIRQREFTRGAALHASRAIYKKNNRVSGSYRIAAEKEDDRPRQYIRVHNKYDPAPRVARANLATEFNISSGPEKK